MCFNESAEYSDSLAAVMNALQKGVGETGCFPVVEILKPQGVKAEPLAASKGES